MKTYYITQQLIYVTVETVNETGNHSVEYADDKVLSFKANVYTNALNFEARNDDLCGRKIKDNVLVRIPRTTPSITF